MPSSPPAPASRQCPPDRSPSARRAEEVATPARPASAAPQQPTFVIDVRHDQPRTLLRLGGELDVATAPLLTAVLDHLWQRQSEPAGHHDVLDVSAAPVAATGTAPTTRARRPGADERLEVDVDLSQVSFADTHGLAPVLDSRARVLAASPAVWRVLRLLAAAGARRSGAAPLAGRHLVPVVSHVRDVEVSDTAGHAEPGP